VATILFSHVLAVFTGDPTDRWVEAHAEVLRQLLAGTVFRELRLDPSAAHMPSTLHLIRNEVAATATDLILVGTRASSHRSRALIGALVDRVPCAIWTAPGAPAATLSRTLVPIDLSERSAEALAVAGRLLSAAGGGRCQALHVRMGPQRLTFEDTDAAGKAKAHEALTNVVARVDAGDVDVDPRVVESPNIPSAILRAAAEQNADLIVMTTRGRTRAAALLLPSETRRVAQASLIPVLALKHPGVALGVAGAWRDPRIRARGDWRFN
jgi:sulfate permease, SulP family